MQQIGNMTSYPVSFSPNTLPLSRTRSAAFAWVWRRPVIPGEYTASRVATWRAFLSL